MVSDHGALIQDSKTVNSEIEYNKYWEPANSKVDTCNIPNTQKKRQAKS